MMAEFTNIHLDEEQFKRYLVVEIFKQLNTRYHSSCREDCIKWAVETYKQIDKEISRG